MTNKKEHDLHRLIQMLYIHAYIQRSCDLYIVPLSQVLDGLGCPLKVVCACATPAVDAAYTHQHEHHSDKDTKQEQTDGYPGDHTVSQAKPVCEVFIALIGTIVCGGVVTSWEGAVTIATPNFMQDWRYGHISRYLNLERQDEETGVVGEQLDSHV